ncbi:hypothetical protein [Fusobacterium nucleatum]|uniref:hypothetical protein n=1 Tax=Fusobacterium nucleatum TaxID=851 RepID=UPI0030D1EF95
MDTISIKLEYSDKYKIYLNELESIKRNLNSFKSEYGYTYIDVLESNEKCMIIKISYPRFFKGNNAFLITKISECLEVQEYFVQQLKLYGYINFFPNINLIRVDIPFTYYMKGEEDFCYYQNIFKIFAYIYKKNKLNASPKAIQDILSGKQETLYYTDTKVIANYNSRIMIYNQDLNISDKYKDTYQNIIKEFPDLKKRIRIEVSKRIKKASIFIKDFANFNILGHYFSSFKKYLLDNLINTDDLEIIYREKVEELTNLLIQEREKRNFTYEAFLLEYINDIWDYEILRRAVKKATANVKTYENAITSIRKILKKYEERNSVMILDVYNTIYKISEDIENIF